MFWICSPLPTERSSCDWQEASEHVNHMYAVVQKSLNFEMLKMLNMFTYEHVGGGVENMLNCTVSPMLHEHAICKVVAKLAKELVNHRVALRSIEQVIAKASAGQLRVN